VKNCRLPNLFRQEYQTELRSSTQSWARGMANRAGTKPGTCSGNAQGRAFVHPDAARPTRYRPNKPAFSLCLPIFLSQKLSPTPVLAHGVLPRRVLAAAAFSAVHPILRRSPFVTVPRHPRCCAPCSHAPSPARTEVLLTPPFPTRRSWPLRRTASARRCYDESTCCKRIFQVFHRYVVIVSYGCCKCFIGVLQVFQRFVQNVSSVPDTCCKRSDLNIAYVSHTCCNNMFQMFQLFQSYVAVSVFMLQVASVLSRCCICFTHPYVASVRFRCVSYVSCIHEFYVARVLCCLESQEAWGVMVTRQGVRERGAASWDRRSDVIGAGCACMVG
jgi:hypothetical protein